MIKYAQGKCGKILDRIMRRKISRSQCACVVEFTAWPMVSHPLSRSIIQADNDLSFLAENVSEEQNLRHCEGFDEPWIETEHRSRETSRSIVEDHQLCANYRSTPPRVANMRTEINKCTELKRACARVVFKQLGRFLAIVGHTQSRDCGTQD